MALILQTTRLLVREFSLADAPALQLICGNRRTMRHVGDGTTLDLARCTEWIRVSLRDYAGKGYGAWAVFVQGVEPMAGYAGIVSAARRADPEIIYALQPQWWRQGLASELIPALLHHGFSRRQLPRLVATIAPANIASCRAVERAGMQCAGEEIEPDGTAMLVYVMEAPRREHTGQ
ncbi:MAG: GNAT family N-acetyltransferase [Chromatiales bacterium]|nr:GNAT family N-acetyltransferase [Chromatiales bacterium]